jgi:hypothetical protein
MVNGFGVPCAYVFAKFSFAMWSFQLLVGDVLAVNLRRKACNFFSKSL